MILGCNCSGCKEGVVGTLSCRSKKDRDSLLQELNTLKSILGGFSVDDQAQEFAGAIRALHSNFSRITISPIQGRMDQANENVGLAYLKKNIRCLYKMMAIGIMDKKEIAQEVKSMGEVVSYTSY